MSQFSKVEFNNEDRGFLEEQSIVELQYDASLVGFIRTVTLILANPSQGLPTLVSGTHTGANNSSSLVDSQANFISSLVQPGDLVTNTTDGNALYEVVGRTSSTEVSVQLITSGGGDDDFDLDDAYTVQRRNIEDIYIPFVTRVRITGRDINKVLLDGIVQETLPIGDQGRVVKVVVISHEAEMRDSSPQSDTGSLPRSAIIQDALNQRQTPTVGGAEAGPMLFPFNSNFDGGEGIEHSQSDKLADPDFSRTTRSALSSFLDYSKTEYWAPVGISEPANPVIDFTTSSEVQELVFPSAQGNLAQGFKTAGTGITRVSKVGLYLGTTGTAPTGNVYVRLEANDPSGASGGDIPSGELVTPWSESVLVNISDVTAGGAILQFPFPEPVALRGGKTYWIVLSYQEATTTGYSATVDFVKWSDDGAAGYADGEMAQYSTNAWSNNSAKDFRFQVFEHADAVYFYDVSGDAWEDQTTEVETEDVSRGRFLATIAGAGATEDRLYIRTGAPLQQLRFLVENTAASAEYGTVTVRYLGTDKAKIVGLHDGADQAVTLTDTDKEFRLSGVAVGDIIHNKRDDSYAVVTAITETTLEGTLQGGTDTDYDIGDGYSVLNLELRASGTHSGGTSATILTDSGANFDDAGVREGDLIVNVTDGAVGVITAYTATTITAASGGMSWSASAETYQVLSRWRTLILKETNVAFTEFNTVTLEWEIPNDWVPSILAAGSPEASAPGFADVGDMRGYWLSIQSSVSPATKAEIDLITPGPGSGYLLCGLDETHDDVIVESLTHDGTTNNASFIDTGEDFIGTHGILIGDIIDNLTDGSTGVVSGIGTDTNLYDKILVADGLSGGSQNDFDTGDAIRIRRARFKTCYFRMGSKPWGGPQEFGQTIRQKGDSAKQIWSARSGEFSKSTRSSVNRVRVIGRTSGGAVIDVVADNTRAQRTQSRTNMTTIVDYSIRSTGEANVRADTELARLSNQSQRGVLQTFRLPFYTRIAERRGWAITGTDVGQLLDGSIEPAGIYEHNGGNDLANLIDTEVNFKKWGVEAGDLVTNATAGGGTQVVSSITTTTNEGDTLVGVAALAGGADTQWDNSDEYRVERRSYVRVGDLIRVQIDEPNHIDDVYLVAGIEYKEPSFVCTLKVTKNFTSSAIGDFTTGEEVFQKVQDDARRGVQRGGY